MYYNPAQQGYLNGYTPPNPIGGVGYNLTPYQYGQQYNPYQQASPYTYNQANGQQPIGYGSGYYSGNYGIVNPYLYQQQLEEQRKQQAQQEEMERGFLKGQIRAYNRYYGIEMSEEEIEARVNPQPPTPQKVEWSYLSESERADCKSKMVYEQNVQDNMPLIMSMQGRQGPVYTTEEVLDSRRINQVHASYQSIINKDMGLAEYWSVAVPKIAAMQDAVEIAKHNSTLTKTYNSEQYNRLLDRHKSEFGGLFSSPNIDDQEIKLPPELQISNATRQDRKRQFLASIQAQMVQ